MPGKLVLIGTPLGNREDLSPRARRALGEADLLLCEDTRSPQRLLGGDERLPERISCFVGNEHERIAMLRDRLAAGQTVAFVSEAGLPVWSDPGRLLVAAAVEAGFEIDVIPGPTAATCALALSGFVAERARFYGFLPRAGAERDAVLAELADERGAALIYEAGNRVPALLRDLASGAGSRAIVIVREFSKLHQEVIRGRVDELAERIAEPLRGEVTLVLAGLEITGAEPVVDARSEGAKAALEVMLDASLKPRARAKALAELTGLDARELYERLSSARE
ncbi:16S rRNA (cytidine(1402)-2'-O)-methyltransferase [Nannocystaceae bacterium ST9]